MNNCADYKFIDIHYHASPDLYERRYTALEAGYEYQSMSAAVVLKSHLGSTAVQATIAQQLNLPVFPSVVLNYLNGGVHYRTILRALNEYQSSIPSKMIVDFPTLTGRQIHSKLTRTLCHPSLSEYSLHPETIFDGNNSLGSNVIDILKMAQDYPIVLSTGHASADEVFALIDGCIQYNVPALLLNQPANPLTGLDADMLLKLAENHFLWIEQTALTYLLGHQGEDDFNQVLSSVPRVIYSSDLGQTNQMDISQWYVFTKQRFTQLGLPEARQALLMKDNAAQLLGLGK